MAAAHAEEWEGRDVTIAEIERHFADLRLADDGHSDMRTSVMSHMAWVPGDWLRPAREALAGLAERHPSRTILLVPEPESSRDAIDAAVSVQCFAMPGQERHVCTEVVELHLHGARAQAPGSIAEPLLIADLPAFLRWRGRPPFGSPEWDQLTGVADRLIVDSGEWGDLPAAYRDFCSCFERLAASDIAWCRTRAWRGRLAQLWPAIGEIRTLRVEGPEADALLLAGWLRSRLARDVDLEREDAPHVESVAVDGQPVAAPRGRRASASDLLSAELDRFGRDRIYEEAVRAAA